MEYVLLKKHFYKDKTTYQTIYEQRKNHEFSTHIPIKIHEHDAFFVYTPELVSLISSIHQADKQLQKISDELPRIAIKQFRMRNLINEVKLTNELEGVNSTRKEIKEILTTSSCIPKKRLQGLITKYHMLQQEQIPLNCCADIRKLYNELVLDEITNEDTTNVPDGVYFRKEQVYVKDKYDRPIHTGVFPEAAIIESIDTAIEVLQNPSIDRLIGISIFHYLIGYIHPFYDGNGRLSRFISSYLLADILHPLVSYNLSYTIKKNSHKYYKAFDIVNDPFNRGDLTPFIILFLELILQASKGLNEQLHALEDKLYFYATALNEKTNINAHEGFLYILLQNTLFGEDGLTITELTSILQKSESSVRNYIKEYQEYITSTNSAVGKLYDVNLDLLH